MTEASNSNSNSNSNSKSNRKRNVGSNSVAGKDATAAPPVKISCQSVWKLYGENAKVRLEQLRMSHTSPAGLRQSLLDAGLIVAAADVSFDVYAGEIFIIMGLSGSGKSTMVRCLSRLVEPTLGDVLLDGEDLLAARPKDLIDIRRHRMGMVFQNFGLMPHLTVLENIAFPLKLQGKSSRERIARAAEVIKLVGLEGREHSFPRELSGGQQQRVGIARSLAVEPDVWLLDEPFSALDPLIRRQMQDEFLRLQSLLNKTIVFITHDFLEALRLADRIAIMKDGQLVQVGTPTELVLNPANDYVAEFTKDVPRDRVITVGELTAEPVNRAESVDVPDGTPAVDGHTTLDAVMPLFEAHPNGVHVKHDGQTQGVVTPAMVIKALAQQAAPA